MKVEREELLLARGLGKAFSARAGLAHTVARRLLRLGRAPERRYVFRHVDFTLLPGECVALVGGNGSGKSTFLRCLGGVIEPTNGQVLRIGRLASLLSHGFGAYEDLPVWQNIVLSQQLLGGTLRHAHQCLAGVAEMAELSDRLYSPTSQLSEGMRAKIALSGLVFADFQVALLDESLNHVDTDFRDRFFDLTRKWLKMGRGLVITSHDDHLLRRFATRKLHFENQGLVEMKQ
jgi:ABC-type polysaccharide/polyol phosphate transport system ATPase subunit